MAPLMGGKTTGETPFALVLGWTPRRFTSLSTIFATSVSVDALTSVSWLYRIYRQKGSGL